MKQVYSFICLLCILLCISYYSYGADQEIIISKQDVIHVDDHINQVGIQWLLSSRSPMILSLVRHDETEITATTYECLIDYERYDYHGNSGTAVTVFIQSSRIQYLFPDQSVTPYYGFGLRTGFIYDNYGQPDLMNYYAGVSVIFGGYYAFHKNISLVAESQIPLDYRFNSKRTDTTLEVNPRIRIGFVYYF